MKSVAGFFFDHVAPGSSTLKLFSGAVGSTKSTSTVPSASARTVIVQGVPSAVFPESSAVSVPSAPISLHDLLASVTVPASTPRYFALRRPVRGMVSVNTPARRFVVVSNTGTSANVRVDATEALSGSAPCSPPPVFTGSATRMVTATVRPSFLPVAARNTAVNVPACVGTPKKTTSCASLSNAHLTPDGSEPEYFFTVVASVALSSRAIRVSASGT